MIDDRGREHASNEAQAAHGKRGAREFVTCGLPRLGGLGYTGDLRREVEQAQLVRVVQHGDHESLVCRGCDPDIVVLLEEDLAARLVECRVDDGEALERADDRLDDKGEIAQSYAFGGGGGLGLFAECDELGHIALLDIGVVHRGGVGFREPFGDPSSHASEGDGLRLWN